MSRPDLLAGILDARSKLTRHIQPRDDTERAIVNALGDCSWDECVTAIQRYRSEQPTRSDD